MIMAVTFFWEDSCIYVDPCPHLLFPHRATFWSFRGTTLSLVILLFFVTLYNTFGFSFILVANIFSMPTQLSKLPFNFTTTISIHSSAVCRFELFVSDTNLPFVCLISYSLHIFSSQDARFVSRNLPLYGNMLILNPLKFFFVAGIVLKQHCLVLFYLQVAIYAHPCLFISQLGKIVSSHFASSHLKHI